MRMRIIFHIGYLMARLFDNYSMPLGMSIGEMLIIGSIGIGLMLLLGILI